MKIKFIKEYVAVDPVPTSGIIHRYRVGETKEITPYTAQWLIDNGFAEEVKESGWWKPKEGEGYYFLAKTGKAGSDPWYTDELDEFRYSVGNCFKTKAAAERYRDYLKAVTTVRQDEGVLTPEEIRDVSWAQPMPYVGVSLDNELGVCQKNVEDEVVIASAIYFDTREHAQASRDKHLDEWKIIANYDWSRE